MVETEYCERGKPMSRAGIWLIFGPTLFVASCRYTDCTHTGKGQLMQSQSYRSLVSKLSTLQPGCTVRDVEALLIANRIEYGRNPKSNVIRAIIRGPSKAPFAIKEATSFTFHFDKEGKLQTVDISVSYIGP